ncbi:MULTISPECIES: PAS domain-containing protein [unclassified Minwuia]|uniref:PAS domain-containing protein n=1 Tax=Minwuia sp. IMCC3077 TaxID=3040676 RepID=UPI00247969E5|nr:MULTISPECIES: PAS domain-containing protein [unclassified Minwuia]
MHLWQRLRREAGGRLPHRAAFRPADLVSVLPSLAVVQVLQGGTAFRYRLVGSRIVQIAGRNATGLMLDDELYGAEFSRMISPYQAVVQARAPVQTRSPVLFADTWRASDNMFVPFTTSGDAIDQIIVSVHLADGKTARHDQSGQIVILHDHAV